MHIKNDQILIYTLVVSGPIALASERFGMYSALVCVAIRCRTAIEWDLVAETVAFAILCFNGYLYSDSSWVWHLVDDLLRSHSDALGMCLLIKILVVAK